MVREKWHKLILKIVNIGLLKSKREAHFLLVLQIILVPFYVIYCCLAFTS